MVQTHVYRSVGLTVAFENCKEFGFGLKGDYTSTGTNASGVTQKRPMRVG